MTDEREHGWNTVIHTFIHPACPGNLITLPQLHHSSQTLMKARLAPPAGRFLQTSVCPVSSRDSDDACKHPTSVLLCWSVSPSWLHPLLVLPAGRPSAWCARPFQGPKELYGRERYARRSRRWRDGEQRGRRSVGGSCSGGEGGETSLDIHLPPPWSIYSASSATCTFLSLSLFKKRRKTERAEERRSACTWKREAEERGER